MKKLKLDYDEERALSISILTHIRDWVEENDLETSAEMEMDLGQRITGEVIDTE